MHQSKAGLRRGSVSSQGLRGSGREWGGPGSWWGAQGCLEGFQAHSFWDRGGFGPFLIT